MTGELTVMIAAARDQRNVPIAEDIYVINVKKEMKMKKILSTLILIFALVSMVVLSSCSRVCQTCNGAGEFTCDRCGGDKVATCQKCGGDGYYDCDICGGLGWRTCPYCNGEDCDKCIDGKMACGNVWPCADCGYDGEVHCNDCNDSGIKDCPDC